MTDPRTAHRVYEGLVTHFYVHELSPGACFIDIGANVGHHTWQMAQQVGPTGRGFAIEAVPALADRVRTVMRNKDIDWVTTIDTALSDQTGTAQFYFRPSHIGWSSLYEGHVHPDDRADDLELIDVQVRTLDDVLGGQVDELAFIKLDIEHSEFRAMRGGRILIEATRPTLVFENSPLAASKFSGYPIEEFFAFFDDIDYHLHDIFLRPFGPASIEGKRQRDLPSYYVALPAEHPAADDPQRHFEIDAAIERLSA